MVNMLPATLVLTVFLTAYAVSAGTSLKQLESLAPGGSITEVNGCSLVYGTDGSVKLLFSRGTSQLLMWTADTSDPKPRNLVMQDDGNLVAYNQDGDAYWETETDESSDAPFRLDLQDNCNLVVYNSANRVLWASDTAGRIKRTMFENVKFMPGDLLVSEAAPTCWMTFTRNLKGTNALYMKSGKEQVWLIGGPDDYVAMPGDEFLYLTPEGRVVGKSRSAFQWKGLGKADKGVAPYQATLAAPSGVCTFEIRDSTGAVVFSK